MYHLRVTWATTVRILRQLTHDPRTIALIFVVPCVLLGLLRWLYSDHLTVFNTIAPALLGIFPFVIMFIITSISTLRERTGGTLERLMAMPMGRLDFIVGYLIAFGLLAALQAIVAGEVLIRWYVLDISGPEWFLLLVAVADALLGAALGLFVSAFARTEFQAVQFMPALILPQFLICGLLVPLDSMPSILETVAYWLPLTYAVDALNLVVKHADITAEMWRDLWVVLGFVAGSVVLGALSLRRRS